MHYLCALSLCMLNGRITVGSADAGTFFGTVVFCKTRIIFNNGSIL